MPKQQHKKVKLYTCMPDQTLQVSMSAIEPEWPGFLSDKVGAGRKYLPLFALVCLLALTPFGCAEPVDVDALISEALAIQTAMDGIVADRDETQRELLSVWDRVEKGPQMFLNARLDVALSQESVGWTVDAGKTRADAYREFDASPLVVKAKELASLYEWLDALWVTKNQVLGDVLIDIHPHFPDEPRGRLVIGKKATYLSRIREHLGW